MTGSNHAVVSEAELGRPAETALGADAVLQPNFSGAATYGTAPAQGRHSDVANASYCDGHVKSAPCTKLTATVADLSGRRHPVYKIGSGGGLPRAPTTRGTWEPCSLPGPIVPGAATSRGGRLAYGHVGSRPSNAPLVSPRKRGTGSLRACGEGWGGVSSGSESP